MLSIEKVNFHVLVEEARIRCREKKWKQALELYNEALQIHPNSMICRLGVLKTKCAIKNTELGKFDQNITCEDPKKNDTIDNKGEVHEINESIFNESNKTAPKKDHVYRSIMKDNPFQGVEDPLEFKELWKLPEEDEEDINYNPRDFSTKNIEKHLSFLTIKEKEWTNLKPLYNGSQTHDPVLKELFYKWIKEIETIQEASQLIKSGEHVLYSLEKANLHNSIKYKFKGKLYYLILLGCVDTQDYNEAVEYVEKIMDVVTKNKDAELEIKTRYIEGRIKALNGDFTSASIIWKSLISVTTDTDRLTQLAYCLCCCYIKQEMVETSLGYVSYALELTNKSNNNIWRKHISILGGQYELNRGYKTEAMKYFKIAESAAQAVNDLKAINYIKGEKIKLSGVPARLELHQYNETIKAVVTTEKPRSLRKLTIRKPKTPVKDMFQLLQTINVDRRNSYERKRSLDE